MQPFRIVIKRLRAVYLTSIFALVSACAVFAGDDMQENTMTYTMPAEGLPHEGTWLTWPHSLTYGKKYRDQIEPIWVAMTKSLHTGENVHIIAYNSEEQARITQLLTNARIDMGKVDFVLAKSDDVWVRDTGPMFVFDANNKLRIADFGFDGWGKKLKFEHDNQIPIEAGKQKSIPVIDIANFVLEGGSIELDGSGTLMATLSSVCSDSRNTEMKLAEVERYLRKYFSVSNFIWLTGVIGEDITDAHIDGIARFLDERTIATVSKDDFATLYESINMNDYRIMQDAKNARGERYTIIEFPVTAKNVKGLAYKGSYLNYYIGNDVVIVPTYNDENDAKAIRILTEIYAKRKIVPIDVTNLYKHGGMIHCVTQQQPRAQ